MNLNYNKLSQLYIEELISKLGHNKQISVIKELFEKNNQTLCDYFTQCTKITENSNKC
jgi:hypothetical protein